MCPAGLRQQAGCLCMKGLGAGCAASASACSVRIRAGACNTACSPSPAAPLPPASWQAKGKLKHVGATNFDVPRMQEMLDAGVKLVNNQAGSTTSKTAAEAVWALVESGCSLADLGKHLLTHPASCPHV